MRLPSSEQALVEREKITEYLLSTTNSSGRSKAFFFLRFGFNANSWEIFAEALKLQGSVHEVVRTVQTNHGLRYYVDGVIATPDGRNPRIRPVWQVDLGTNHPRLITAHPHGR